MAPLPTIPNVYRVALGWTNSDTGLTAANVMHFRKAGSNPAALFTAFDSHVTQAMWDHTNTHSKIGTMNITPLDGSSVTLPEVITPAAKYGGGFAGTAIIPTAAALVKLVTGKRGRSYRGRLFLPWVDEAAYDEGMIVGANNAAMQTAWSTFVSAMSGDGFDLVVASYVHSTAENVVGLLCELHTGTIRRRWQRVAT
jgi:hypothetical protein